MADHATKAEQRSTLWHPVQFGAKYPSLSVANSAMLSSQPGSIFRCREGSAARIKYKLFKRTSASPLANFTFNDRDVHVTHYRESDTANGGLERQRFKIAALVGLALAAGQDEITICELLNAVAGNFILESDEVLEVHREDDPNNSVHRMAAITGVNWGEEDVMLWACLKNGVVSADLFLLLLQKGSNDAAINEWRKCGCLVDNNGKLCMNLFSTDTALQLIFRQDMLAVMAKSAVTGRDITLRTKPGQPDVVTIKGIASWVLRRNREGAWTPMCDGHVGNDLLTGKFIWLNNPATATIGTPAHELLSNRLAQEYTTLQLMATHQFLFGGFNAQSLAEDNTRLEVVDDAPTEAGAIEDLDPDEESRRSWQKTLLATGLASFPPACGNIPAGPRVGDKVCSNRPRPFGNKGVHTNNTIPANTEGTVTRVGDNGLSISVKHPNYPFSDRSNNETEMFTFVPNIHPPAPAPAAIRAGSRQDPVRSVAANWGRLIGFYSTLANPDSTKEVRDEAHRNVGVAKEDLTFALFDRYHMGTREEMDATAKMSLQRQASINVGCPCYESVIATVRPEIVHTVEVAGIDSLGEGAGLRAHLPPEMVLNVSLSYVVGGVYRSLLLGRSIQISDFIQSSMPPKMLSGKSLSPLAVPVGAQQISLSALTHMHRLHSEGDKRDLYFAAVERVKEILPTVVSMHLTGEGEKGQSHVLTMSPLVVRAIRDDLLRSCSLGFAVPAHGVEHEADMIYINGGGENINIFFYYPEDYSSLAYLTDLQYYTSKFGTASRSRFNPTSVPYYQRMLFANFQQVMGRLATTQLAMANKNLSKQIGYCLYGPAESRIEDALVEVTRAWAALPSVSASVSATASTAAAAASASGSRLPSHLFQMKHFIGTNKLGSVCVVFAAALSRIGFKIICHPLWEISSPDAIFTDFFDIFKAVMEEVHGARLELDDNVYVTSKYSSDFEVLGWGLTHLLMKSNEQIRAMAIRRTHWQTVTGRHVMARMCSIEAEMEKEGSSQIAKKSRRGKCAGWHFALDNKGASDVVLCKNDHSNHKCNSRICEDVSGRFCLSCVRPQGPHVGPNEPIICPCCRYFYTGSTHDPRISHYVQEN